MRNRNVGKRLRKYMAPVAGDAESDYERDRLMQRVTRQHPRLRCMLSVLALAAAYAVAAWLGLWLAIPPGYATAVWPASGLALAGALIGCARVWPGIWLGSFVANLWTAWDTSHAAALLASVAIPTSIGAGATLQALVGAALVRRWVGFPCSLTGARAIGTFLLLGGPLSCLVSATVGVTTLAVSGQIPWSLFVMTWWTWWVGDTLGVIIATPLVLSWLAEPRDIWRRRRLSVGLPMVVALALGFVVFGYGRAQERARLGLLFERQGESLAHAIRTRLDDYMDVLYALESFYASAPEVSRQAFHTFVQRSFVRYSGLRALSLALRVPDAQREAYEHTVRREGFADFQIIEHTAPGELVQAERRPEYIAVTYIEPRVGNETAFGLDIASVPDRLDALQQARDTGQPTATGRLTLVQEPGHPSGLLVFLPLYGSALPPATLEERRQSLRGYITGVFQIGAMVESALQGLGSGQASCCGSRMRRPRWAGVCSMRAAPGRQTTWARRALRPSGSLLSGCTGRRPWISRAAAGDCASPRRLSIWPPNRACNRGQCWAVDWHSLVCWEPSSLSSPDGPRSLSR